MARGLRGTLPYRIYPALSRRLVLNIPATLNIPASMACAVRCSTQDAPLSTSCAEHRVLACVTCGAASGASLHRVEREQLRPISSHAPSGHLGSDPTVGARTSGAVSTGGVAVCAIDQCRSSRAAMHSAADTSFQGGVGRPSCSRAVAVSSCRQMLSLISVAIHSEGLVRRLTVLVSDSS